jgi:hypothetical protein
VKQKVLFICLPAIRARAETWWAEVCHQAEVRS